MRIQIITSITALAVLLGNCQAEDHPKLEEIKRKLKRLNTEYNETKKIFEQYLDLYEIENKIERLKAAQGHLVLYQYEDNASYKEIEKKKQKLQKELENDVRYANYEIAKKKNIAKMQEIYAATLEKEDIEKELRIERLKDANLEEMETNLKRLHTEYKETKKIIEQYPDLNEKEIKLDRLKSDLNYFKMYNDDRYRKCNDEIQTLQKEQDNDTRYATYKVALENFKEKKKELSAANNDKEDAERLKNEEENNTWAKKIGTLWKNIWKSTRRNLVTERMIAEIEKPSKVCNMDRLDQLNKKKLVVDLM